MQSDSSFTAIPSPELEGLITRSELWSALFYINKRNISLLWFLKMMNILPKSANLLGNDSLDDALFNRHWSLSDLNLHLHLPFALRKFSEFIYGPGLEDEFLSANGGHDQITYSMLRVKIRALFVNFGSVWKKERTLRRNCFTFWRGF